MVRPVIIVLAVSIAATTLCPSLVAQEKPINPSQTNLAIQIGEDPHEQFQASSVGDVEISPTDKLPDWKQSSDRPPLTHLRVHPDLEGDGVRIKIGAVFDDSEPADAPGPKY